MSPQAPRLTLGGDFELTDISFGNPDNLIKLSQGLAGSWTLSGRSALSLVLRDLQSKGISHIHLPAYLCDSVIAPVEALGLSYSFYEVDLDLVSHPTGAPRSAVLVIDYFGWPNPGVKHVTGGTPLIKDLCQAMLSSWSIEAREGDYLVASPRKFGPTGVGGWCSLAKLGSSPTKPSEEIVERSLNARLRKGRYLSDKESLIDTVVEDSYLNSLLAVEEFLDAHPVESGISELGLQVIAGVDWSFAAGQRRKNWLQLVELLPKPVTPIFDSLPDSVVPLGLVVRVGHRDVVRKRLAAERIFCPVHWPLPKQIDRDRFPSSAELADTLLTLPIDQRYDASDMTRLAEALTRAVEASS